MRLIFSIAVLLLLGGCREEASNSVRDFESLHAFAGEAVQVVVEIPAGTNHKIEYDKARKEFTADQKDGKDRIIDFLPYPGNYGFIPSTYMDPERGGDGDALDILVIGESVPTGTVLQVMPIASLRLLDEGEADTKIIAVPVDSNQRVMKAGNFQEFSIAYDGAKHIIQNWFLYYDGLGTTEFLGWDNEKQARMEIEKWAFRAANTSAAGN